MYLIFFVTVHNCPCQAPQLDLHHVVTHFARHSSANQMVWHWVLYALLQGLSLFRVETHKETDRRHNAMRF